MKLNYLVSILIFCFFFISTTLSQQNKKNAQTILSEKIPLELRGGYHDILGKDENGIFVTKIQKRGVVTNDTVIYLEYLDMNLNVKTTEPVNKEYKDEKRFVEDILFIKGKIWLLTSITIKKEGVEKIMVQQISTKNLKPLSEHKEIFARPLPEKRKHIFEPFKFSFSADSSKILFFHTSTDLPDEKEKVSLYMCNADFDVTWNKEVALPVNKLLLDMEQCCIDKKGNINILCKVFKNERTSEIDGKPNYKYYLYNFSETNNEFNKYSIPSSGRFLNNIKLLLDNDDNIICTGFYGRNSDYGIHGYFLVKLQRETKQTLVKKFSQFRTKFHTQNMSDKEAKRTRESLRGGFGQTLYDYSIYDVVLKEDGGIILIGDHAEKYTREFSYHTNRFPELPRHNVLNKEHGTFEQIIQEDIIVVSMFPDGSKDWTLKIPKKQKSTKIPQIRFSFSMMKNNNKFVFFFNDNPKNLNKTSRDKYNYYNPKLGFPSIVKVELGFDGKYNKEELLPISGLDVALIPHISGQISDNQVVMFAKGLLNGYLIKYQTN